MHKTSLLLLTFILIFIHYIKFTFETTTTASTPTPSSNEDQGKTGTKWSYEDEEKWPKRCLGRLQSPIALTKPNVPDIQYSPIKFVHYNESRPAVLTYGDLNLNGSMVQQEGEFPYISDGPLILLQKFFCLYVHWESEHTLYDKKYPLEVHLIHINSMFDNFFDALEAKDVTVLSILFQEDSKQSGNKIALFDAIKDMTGKGDFINFDLKLSDLLPKNTNSYFTYKGSLDYPPCVEMVTWIVFTEILNISSSQLKNIINNPHLPKSLQRNLQPSYDRPIMLRNGVAERWRLLITEKLLVLCILLGTFN